MSSARPESQPLGGVIDSCAVTSPRAPHGASSHQLTRGRRVSRVRVLVVGAALALAAVVAALGVVELRLRRAETLRIERATAAARREAARREAVRAEAARREALAVETRDAGPPPPIERERVPMMLVDEATCYAGLAPLSEQSFTRPDTPLRHHHVNDAEGFRVADRGAPRAAACRVLAVGDSFTAGLYVSADQAWPAALEARLRARGYSVRVDNGGLQGHTITQERAEVLSRWASLRPRVVVVGRSANDVTDVVNLQGSGCQVGGPAPREFVPSVPEAARDVLLVAGALEARARLRVMTSRLRDLFRGGHSEADAQRCAAAERAYVTEARDLARGAARARTRVLFATFESSWCGDAENHLDVDGFERRLGAAVAAEHARTLDLRAALDPAAARLRPWDLHPSAVGHDALAAGIADDLVASGWLEGCR